MLVDAEVVECGQVQRIVLVGDEFETPRKVIECVHLLQPFVGEPLRIVYLREQSFVLGHAAERSLEGRETLREAVKVEQRITFIIPTLSGCSGWIQRYSLAELDQGLLELVAMEECERLAAVVLGFARIQLDRSVEPLQGSFVILRLEAVDSEIVLRIGVVLP